MTSADVVLIRPTIIVSIGVAGVVTGRYATIIVTSVATSRSSCYIRFIRCGCNNIVVKVNSLATKLFLQMELGQWKRTATAVEEITHLRLIEILVQIVCINVNIHAVCHFSSNHEQFCVVEEEKIHREIVPARKCNSKVNFWKLSTSLTN